MLHSILSVLQGLSCPSGDDDWIAGVEEDVEDPLAQDEVDGGAGDGLLIAFVHSLYQNLCHMQYCGHGAPCPGPNGQIVGPAGALQGDGDDGGQIQPVVSAASGSSPPRISEDSVPNVPLPLPTVCGGGHQLALVLSLYLGKE